MNNRNATGGGDPDSMSRFNPLIWLAQYLLRNHPRHVKDHRTKMYQTFQEHASIERGRRCLLRRLPQIENMFRGLEQELEDRGEKMLLFHMPVLFGRLDDYWYLQGEFLSKMPKDMHGTIAVEAETGAVPWSNFWRWFEEYVGENDVLRAPAFTDAARRKWDHEQQARKAEEDRVRREQAEQEAAAQRAALMENFDQYTGDMYINEEISRILNKGAVIEGVEEREGEPPLQGEHIVLIRSMLSIWGHPISTPAAPDVWNDAALAAWLNWLEVRGLEGGSLDEAGLRLLMNRGNFQAYLEEACPAKDIYAENAAEESTVRIQQLVLGDRDGQAPDTYYIEAVDEETGQIMELPLTEDQAQDVKKQLEAIAARAEEGLPERLLAHVDIAGGQVIDIIPPASSDGL